MEGVQGPIRVDGRAILAGEHEVRIGVDVGESKSLLRLKSTLGAERGDGLSGERDRSTTRLGLRLAHGRGVTDEDQGTA
ncbi:MAG: hypothetical protein ACXWH5_13770, partial [Actinomycetota bacterium]